MNNLSFRILTTAFILALSGLANAAMITEITTADARITDSSIEGANNQIAVIEKEYGPNEFDPILFTVTIGFDAGENFSLTIEETVTNSTGLPWIDYLIGVEISSSIMTPGAGPAVTALISTSLDGVDSLGDGGEANPEIEIDFTNNTAGQFGPFDVFVTVTQAPTPDRGTPVDMPEPTTLGLLGLGLLGFSLRHKKSM